MPQLKCRSCRKCALYLVPGFVHEERCWCMRKGCWRSKGCKHFMEGKPRRAVLDVYVTVDGMAAVNGDI